MTAAVEAQVGPRMRRHHTPLLRIPASGPSWHEVAPWSETHLTETTSSHPTHNR